MKILDLAARRLLNVLVNHLPKVKPGKPETYIGYKDVHEALGLKLSGSTYGESLKIQGLSSLADWTVGECKPGITGIIIDFTTYTPGKGYFRLFGRSEDDYTWWKDQVQLSKEFDWSPFVSLSSNNQTTIFQTWNKETTQKLRGQLSEMTINIIDYLAEHPDKKFTTQDLVEANNLDSAESLRSYLGTTTISAKKIGVSQDYLHSWFVLWEEKPEWRYWLDTERSKWWLSSSVWSYDELRATVEIYLEMLHLARRGKTFSKKSYYESLASRYGRTIKAYEYRAQNISYVFDLMGREWLPGLIPARNVGLRNIERIEQIISEIEGTVNKGEAKFEFEIKTALKKKKLAKPKGNEAPKATNTTTTTYQRDKDVVAWILASAGGQCEYCGCIAPFITGDGRPFLEVHHVQSLADGGSDTIENAIAVCPNCHRSLHYANDRVQRTATLYEKITRLEKRYTS